MYRSTAPSHNLRFVLICLALFACGGYLRYRSGWLALPRAAAAPPPVTAAGALPEPGATAQSAHPLSDGGAGRGTMGSGGPSVSSQAAVSGTVPSQQPAQPGAVPPEVGELVVRFYNLITKGKYNDAYQLVLEAKFDYLAPKTYRLAGLASQQEVNSELSAAFGINGEMIKLMNIGVIKVTPLPPAERLPERRAELYALQFLPAPSDGPAAGLSVGQVYDVTLGGALIEICSPWSWEKSVLVATLSDGSARILLARHPQGRQEMYQDYFADENMYDGFTIQSAQSEVPAGGDGPADQRSGPSEGPALGAASKGQP